MGRHSSFLHVNLEIIRKNLSLAQKMAPKAKLLPMVKGNAYGNGLVPVSNYLSSECGYNTLGVASLGEALIIADELPTFFAKSERRLVVFSDPEIEDAALQKEYVKRNIVPFNKSLAQVETFLNSSPVLDNVPFFVGINTGMNRHGIEMSDLSTLVDLMKKSPRFASHYHGVHHQKKLRIDHFMTHFGSSGDLLQDGDRTSTQYQLFQQAKDLLRNHYGVDIVETSASNSAAIMQGVGVEESWVRPGLMTYGPHPCEPETGHAWHGEQCSHWRTHVLSATPRKKGQLIGYTNNYPLKEDSLVVQIPVGYADGLSRLYFGFTIDVQGFKGTLQGVTCMDSAAFAFPMEAYGKIVRGDPVSLWTHDHTVIDNLAVKLNTNAYQLMCGVSDRIPRVYYTGDEERLPPS